LEDSLKKKKKNYGKTLKSGNFKQEETQVSPIDHVTMKICLEDPQVYSNLEILWKSIVSGGTHFQQVFHTADCVTTETTRKTFLYSIEFSNIPKDTVCFYQLDALTGRQRKYIFASAAIMFSHCQAFQQLFFNSVFTEWQFLHASSTYRPCTLVNI